MANLILYATVSTLDNGMFMHTEIDEGAGFVTRKFLLSTLEAHLFAASGTSVKPLIKAAAMDSVSDTAACSVANYFTTLTTTGAAVPTLADGSENQMKKIQMIVGVGDAVLTPANLTGGTTITFADVGDTAELIFTGGSWQVVALYNIVDGATAPVLA